MLVAAPIAAALTHGLYVVYIGGDFMHARLLLPDLFALLLPVAMIGVDILPVLVPTLAVVTWALVCATALRPSYNGIGPYGIADERSYYVARAQHAHPITPDDYRLYPSAGEAFAQRKQLTAGGLLTQSGAQVALRPGVQAEAVVEGLRIGIYGYIFGTNVHVVDLFGLADPIAGRLELAKRGRPGHEKQLSEAWVVARFADPGALAIGGVTSADVNAARSALSCDGVQRLLAAVTERMTPGRFARNLLEAFRLQRLRIPLNPVEAQAKLC